MNVLPISQNNGVNFQRSKNINTVSVTGYGAIGFGVASAIAASRKKIKLHKWLAYITGILAFIHIGIIEYNKYKYNRDKTTM